MTMLKTPEKYAEMLLYCYGKERFVEGVVEAIKAHPQIPASYWSDVLEYSTTL